MNTAFIRIIFLFSLCGGHKKAEAESSSYHTHNHHKESQSKLRHDIVNRRTTDPDSDLIVVAYTPCTKRDCTELPKSLDSLVAQHLLDSNVDPKTQLDIYIFATSECQTQIETWIYEKSGHLYGMANLYVRDAIEAQTDFKEAMRKHSLGEERYEFAPCAETKLSIPHVLHKQTIERVLLLDCDTRIVQTLTPLFTMEHLDSLHPDNNAAVFALAADIRRNQEHGKANFQFTGLDGEIFFNTGVALIDVQSYVKSGFLESFLKDLPKFDAHFKHLRSGHKDHKHHEGLLSRAEEKIAHKLHPHKHSRSLVEVEASIFGHHAHHHGSKPSAQVEIPLVQSVRTYRDSLNQFAEWLNLKEDEKGKKIFVQFLCIYNVRPDSFCTDDPVILHAKGEVKDKGVWTEKSNLIEVLGEHVRHTRGSYTALGSVRWFKEMVVPWGPMPLEDEQGLDLLQQNVPSLFQVGKKLYDYGELDDIRTYGSDWFEWWGSAKGDSESSLR